MHLPLLPRSTPLASQAPGTRRSAVRTNFASRCKASCARTAVLFAAACGHPSPPSAAPDADTVERQRAQSGHGEVQTGASRAEGEERTDTQQAQDATTAPDLAASEAAANSAGADAPVGDAPNHGAVDTAAPETKAADTAAQEAGAWDSGKADAAKPDAGVQDASPADAAMVDAGALDTGKADSGAPDTSTPGADAADAMATTAATPSAPVADWQPVPSGDPNSAGLVNASTDLAAVLEGGKLANACNAWFATQGKGTLQQKLLCGKAMFFYESFGTYGVPQALVDFMVQHLPNSVGAGMAAFGMHLDPNSQKKLPLGLAPGANLPNTAVPTYTFTCASCHFGKLADGRYVVGQANHDYDYGRQLLALNLFPKMATGLEPASKHAPQAVAAVQPLIDEYKSKPQLGLQFGWAMLQLVGALGSIPTFTVANEAAYASWLPGTQDFLMAPVVVDDGAHTVSKIISLFNLPTPAQIQAAKMKHALLGWTGVSASLPNFLRGFAALGAGDAGWPPEKLEPLQAYLQTLSALANPSPPPANLVSQGKALFSAKGCTDCHGGPGLSGVKVYTYKEMGTDAAMAGWLDPDLDGVPIANPILMTGDSITNGIKAPRLRGVWSAKPLLHNGSVDSLEKLFCLGYTRPTVTAPPFGDGGHWMTCQGLSDAEKSQLIAYLRSL